MSLLRLISLGLAIFCGAVLYDSLRAKKIFVSYKYSGDAKYKNLLVAWSRNYKFSVDFSDVSSDISIDSLDEVIIKQGILPSIGNADIFLCIIGPSTYKSKMVAWEIQKAIELKKKIVAVKINKKYTSPNSIKNVNAIWALKFTEEEIVKALKKASC